MNAPLNFAWHIPDLLATGGKPDTDEKLDWLLAQGFSCFISLEAIPDNITRRIARSNCSCAQHEVEEGADPPISKLADFIASHILNERKTYIHCSAGATRSPRLARAFIAHQDLYMANYLGRRANDLNHGDEYDWIRGHDAFYGKTLGRAITALEKGLQTKDNETRLAAADTLIELMEHADHGCFDDESLKRLKELSRQALRTAIKLNRRHLKQYRQIYADFCRLKICRSKVPFQFRSGLDL